MKKRVFWFHYNKPASQKAGKPQITVHYKGTCHIVDNIDCFCSTYGVIRKSQPFFVMKGFCWGINIVGSVATIS
mgnify:CR=1 FL=1